MNKNLIFSIIILTISLLTGCGRPGVNDHTAEDYQIVTEANNRFASDLLKVLETSGRDENIFISPISIHAALAMAYNGAEEMKNVLHIDNISAEELNNAYASFLNRAEKEDFGAKINIANSLWLREGYPFEKTFVDNIEKYFQATINEADFHDPKTKDTINGWVEKQTNGKIKNIIGNMKPNTILYLLNAIYFKGDWKYEFNKQNTFVADFYLENGQPIETTYMSQTKEFKYFEMNSSKPSTYLMKKRPSA